MFDQATPVPLRPFLEGTWSGRPRKQGWSQLRNGELLNAAEAVLASFLEDDERVAKKDATFLMESCRFLSLYEL